MNDHWTEERMEASLLSLTFFVLVYYPIEIYLNKNYITIPPTFVLPLNLIVRSPKFFLSKIIDKG